MKSAAWLDTPVTFPPGRAKLSTSPTPTGSATFTNTMGIVGVACLAARAAGAEWRHNDIHVEPDQLGG